MRAGPVHGPRLDQHVRGFGAVRARIHAQRAADRARNAAIEGEAGNARLRRPLREPHIGHRRARPDAMPVLGLDLAEAAPAQPDHHARNAAVAHQQVGADADRRDGQIGGQMRQDIGQIGLIGGREEDLRRTTDAEPGDIRHRLAGFDATAQVGEAGLQLGCQIGKTHRRTLGRHRSGEPTFPPAGHSLSQGERVGVRGYALSKVTTPSPGRCASTLSPRERVGPSQDEDHGR